MSNDRRSPDAAWSDLRDPPAYGDRFTSDHGGLRSLDGAAVGPFTQGDVAEVLYHGENGDRWDGKEAAVIRLGDGRFVGWETWWGPTGSGFCDDAYGGDAEILFASDLRLLVNELSDEGRRLAGVPEELWNG